MKVIIQLQYSVTDSRVFHDVKNITQSSLHSTQPNPPKIKKNWPNPTQPMDGPNSVFAHSYSDNSHERANENNML